MKQQSTEQLVSPMALSKLIRKEKKGPLAIAFRYISWLSSPGLVVVILLTAVVRGLTGIQRPFKCDNEIACFGGSSSHVCTSMLRVIFGDSTAAGNIDHFREEWEIFRSARDDENRWVLMN